MLLESLKCDLLTSECYAYVVFLASNTMHDFTHHRRSLLSDMQMLTSRFTLSVLIKYRETHTPFHCFVPRFSLFSRIYCFMKHINMFLSTRNAKIYKEDKCNVLNPDLKNIC